MEQAELIKKCLKGHARAQEQLYNKYKTAMYAICMRYAANTSDAQDMLQEGFIRVFEKLGTLKEHKTLPAWIKRIMVNTCLNHLRKYSKLSQNSPIEDQFDLATDLSSADADLQAEDLAQIIRSLPTDYRVVFNMYALEGYSHKEIASELGLTEANSKVKLSRARAMLKKQLEKYFEVQ